MSTPRKTRFKVLYDGAAATYRPRFTASGRPKCIVCSKPLGKSAVGSWFHSQACAAAFAGIVMLDIGAANEQLAAWEAARRLGSKT